MLYVAREEGEKSVIKEHIDKRGRETSSVASLLMFLHQPNMTCLPDIEAEGRIMWLRFGLRWRQVILILYLGNGLISRQSLCKIKL